MLYSKFTRLVTFSIAMGAAIDIVKRYDRNVIGGPKY